MTESNMLHRAHEGLQLHLRGEHDRAREHLAALWDELGEHGNPIVRCSVAHYLADLQGQDHRSSLRWNAEAVREANRVDDPEYVDPDLGVSTALLYPSLLLNLAEDHRNLGEFEKAVSVLSAARESLARLHPDDRPLGVPEALDKLAERLAVYGGACDRPVANNWSIESRLPHRTGVLG